MALTALTTQLKNVSYLPGVTYRSRLRISSATSGGFAVDCSFISLTAAKVYGSKARLRRATAVATTARVGTPYIKISARRRRVEQAIQLLRPGCPSRAIGQKAGRPGTPKSWDRAWVNLYIYGRMNLLLPSRRGFFLDSLFKIFF